MTRVGSQRHSKKKLIFVSHVGGVHVGNPVVALTQGTWESVNEYMTCN
jgi:hypothetical protein